MFAFLSVGFAISLRCNTTCFPFILSEPSLVLSFASYGLDSVKSLCCNTVTCFHRRSYCFYDYVHVEGRTGVLCPVPRDDMLKNRRKSSLCGPFSLVKVRKSALGYSPGLPSLKLARPSLT